MATEKLVKIEALEVLRDKDGKKVAVGTTTGVLESTAEILVKNKQAKLVNQK